MRLPGKTYSESPAASFRRFKISSAVPVSGMRCIWFVFERSAGSVQNPLSRFTSLQAIRSTSPGR
jgi:hypothetical protein